MQLLANALTNAWEIMQQYPNEAGMIGFGGLIIALLIKWYRDQERNYNNPKR